jgi:putative ATP-binding cassette transporter
METKIKFDQQLWQRFVTITQPYWYPTERGGRWTFVALLGILLVIVISTNFLMGAGLSVLGLAVFSDFFQGPGASLIEDMQNLMKTPAPIVASIAFIVSVLAFYSQRRQLKNRWLQWSFLGILLFLSFALNGVNVVLSFAFRFLDNTLAEKNESVFWQFLTVYVILLFVALPIIIFYRYIRIKLGLYWREWLTHFFMNRYFHDRAYYELDSNAGNTEIDNPDQRITEDINAFTIGSTRHAGTLSFLLDVLDSVLSLISFGPILYRISATLTYGLVGYALIGTIIATFIGAKLLRLNFDQLRFEANFRYGMVHIRDNAESIAFYRGESLESKQVFSRFANVLRNFNLLIIWTTLNQMFQWIYNNFSTRLIPYLVVAPLYFAGQSDFGSISQASVAFGIVLGSLSIVVNQIDGLSQFAAGVDRLGKLYEAIEDPTRRLKDRDSMIQSVEDSRLVLDKLTLLTPNSEQTLMRDLSLSLQPDQRLLIVGVSGSGKSSLLRAIAGLWTNGRGVITRPSINQMLFLPQKPYMLLGTLRDQLLYPNILADISDQQLLDILIQVNLADLPEQIGGFDSLQDWSNVLSLGEQQRLAFARILVAKPKYVILDEATSALDVFNEKMLYERLQSMDAVYLSVGHRSSLLKYHDLVLELDGEGGWQILSIQDYSQRLAAAG